MSFCTTVYQFVVVDSEKGSELKTGFDFECDIAKPLIRTGRLPGLNSAPVASWVLSRLRRLADAIPEQASEESDGGGYSIQFVIFSGHRRVATFLLQGDNEGVGILGRAKNVEVANQMIRHLMRCLLVAPDDVSECVYQTTDPEWRVDPEGFVPRPFGYSKNHFGLRNGVYLGDGNYCDA